tara:strand:- start:2907 stop:3638 length:732 start_codon:yes stop_codon:yes gene_type:complete
MKVALITGGFDTLHSGHLALIKSASEISFLVAVGLNSDSWLYRKKGYVSMPFAERKEILESISGIHKVFGFDDTDDSSCDAIRRCVGEYDVHKIVFCNGGDRTEDNIPEIGTTVGDVKLEFAFGVGGTDKRNSSSELVKIKREWGWWQVLKEGDRTKVKELVILPGKEMSHQRHFKRNELWLVTEGECTVNNHRSTKILKYHEHQYIPVEMWHSIKNHTDKVCKILEIQYGSECSEEDIERYK